MSDLSMSMFASKEDFEAAVAAEQAKKPVVQYTSATMVTKGFYAGRAFVVPVDHSSPSVVNGREAITSEVLGYDEATGMFETRNTIYVPQGTKVVDEDAES